MADAFTLDIDNYVSFKPKEREAEGSAKTLFEPEATQASEADDFMEVSKNVEQEAAKQKRATFAVGLESLECPVKLVFYKEDGEPWNMYVFTRETEDLLDRYFDFMNEFQFAENDDGYVFIKNQDYHFQAVSLSDPHPRGFKVILIIILWRWIISADFNKDYLMSD